MYLNPAAVEGQSAEGKRGYTALNKLCLIWDWEKWQFLCAAEKGNRALKINPQVVVNEGNQGLNYKPWGKISAHVPGGGVLAPLRSVATFPLIPGKSILCKAIFI